MTRKASKLEVPKEKDEDKIYSMVKSTLGLIPGFGGTISEIFSLILTQPISKRREKWMELVSDELLELNKSVDEFNIENLKMNNEFVSFLIESSQIALKTHQEEKINYLKNCVKNFLIDNNFKYDKKHSYLRIVDELTPTHLHILIFVSNNQDYIITNVNGYQELYGFYNNKALDIDYLRKCVRDLENNSLIRISKDFEDLVEGSGFVMTDEGAPSIKLLNTGDEFIQFIQDS